MGAYAGVARLRVHIATVLPPPPSGHRPGRCRADDDDPLLIFTSEMDPHFDNGMRNIYDYGIELSLAIFGRLDGDESP